MHGDLRDPAVVDRLLDGVDVLIHMAGTSVERPLPEIIENNLVGLYQVYEGARRKKVRRMVFASSNHAFGMYPVKDKLELDAPFRPDGFYGLSKVWGEAMARMYWDKHGIEGISRADRHRDGQADRSSAHLSTWFGHEDLVQLMMRCIEPPRRRLHRRVGRLGQHAQLLGQHRRRGLGYQPRQNSEDFAAEILRQPNPLDPVAQQYQGGGFVTLDFTPVDQRPG